MTIEITTIKTSLRFENEKPIFYYERFHHVCFSNKLIITETYVSFADCRIPYKNIISLKMDNRLILKNDYHDDYEIVDRYDNKFPKQIGQY